MKHMKKIVIILIILCLIPLQAMNVSAASKIKISHMKATIKVNQSIQLSLNGTDEIINWTSSNEDVAIVEFGNVKGINSGKATITAEVFDSKNELKKFTCVVTVKKETESKPLQKFIDTLITNAGSNKKDSLVGSYSSVEHYAVVDINSDGVDELIVYKPDKESLIILAVKGNKVIKAGEISDAFSYYGYSLNKKTSAIVNIYEGGYSIFKSWYFKDNKLKAYNDRIITKFNDGGGSYYQGKEEKTITKKKYSEIANKYYSSKDLSPITFASTVKLNKTKLSLVAGESVTLKLLGTSEEPDWIIYGSGATVDEKGKVSTFREGSVTIGANLYGKVYACDIQILNPYLENISYDYEEIYESLNGGEYFDLETGGTTIYRPWNLRMIIPKTWTAITDIDETKNMVMTLKPDGKTENSTIKIYMIEDREYNGYRGKYSEFESFKEKVSKAQFSKKAVLKELSTEVSSTAKIINYNEGDYKAHNHKFYKVEYEASYTIKGEEYTCKKTIYDGGFENYRILIEATDLGETTKINFDTVLNDFINTLLLKREGQLNW